MKAAESMANSIIEALARGVVPWECPFERSQGGDGGPVSIDGRKYRGLNRFILQMACHENGWRSPVFATFKAAKKAGGMVRKGEKATLVTFWKFTGPGSDRGENGGGDGDESDESKKGGGSGYRPDDDGGAFGFDGPDGGEDGDENDGNKKGRSRSPFVVVPYFVFNVAQIDGLPPAPPAPQPVETPIEAADRIIEGFAFRDMPGVDISENISTPCYYPGRDEVAIMPQAKFKSPEWWYHALFHELAHSTGHASRLNRNFKKGDGDGLEARAREELLADMTAAMLDQHAGIVATRDNTAAYCASWLKEIRAMPGRTLLTVAAQAQKAYDYIIGGQA